MGIPGLFQMLKRHEQKVYIPTCIRGRTVAIDIFTYLHKSKGSQKYLMELLSPFIHNVKHLIAVFDGSPSEERSESLVGVADKRKSLIQDISAIKKVLSDPFINISYRDKLYLTSYLKMLEQQAWTPSPQYMWEVYDLLKANNIECIVLDKGQEADTYLCNINADIIVSNDSDLLANGIKCLLRPNGTYYEAEAVLSGLQFTGDEWRTFIKLCRTMKRPDPEFIFTVMKLYRGDAEYIYERYESIFI